MSVTNSLLEAFMLYSTERQKVLSENVARVNSPGEISQDITMPQNFEQLVKEASEATNLRLSRTNPNHISSPKPKMKFRVKMDPEAVEYKPNGNNINLQQQAKKAVENKIMYDTALEAYKKSTTLMRSALGKGK